MHEGVLFFLPPDKSVGSQKDHGHQASCHPSAPLPATGRLRPQDALPARGLREALLDGTTGGTVTEEEEENGLCRQLNRSERWLQGGMAIPARTCPYHAGNVSHPKGIPTTCLGGYKRFSAALGKQKIY